MNKKTGVILMLALMGIAVGLYFWQNRKPSDSVYFAEYLPSDTLGIVSLTDLNRVSDTFASSPPGKLLAKETMAVVFAELKVQEEAIAEYNQAYDEIAELLGNPAFRTVFGDDTTIGLFSPDLSALQRTPDMELRRSVIVFATTAVTGALEQLAKLLVSDTVATEEVHGRKLTRITVDNAEEIWGYADKGIVLLAFDPEVIVRGLAVRESGNGLAGVVSFGDAVGFWETYEPDSVLLRSYVNVERLQDLMKKIESDEVKGAADYLNGIRYLAAVSGQDGDELHSDAKAGFTSGALHELVQAAISNQVPANTTLHMLRDKCLMYDWASTLIPDIMLNAAGPGTDEDVLLLENLIQQELGVSLDDLFKAFGPQYGFTVNQIINGGFIPIPQVTAFVQVRDHSLAKKVFAAMRQRIEKSGLASEERSEVGEYTMHVWPILPAEATQPAMTLTSDMLYFANGKSVLAEMLTADGAKNKVNERVAGVLGTDLTGQVEGARLGTFVLYPARLAEEIDEIAQWLMNTIVATQGVSVERLGREIIGLMKAYEVMVASSTLTDESGHWRFTLKRKETTGSTTAK